LNVCVRIRLYTAYVQCTVFLALHLAWVSAIVWLVHVMADFIFRTTMCAFRIGLIARSGSATNRMN